jgi:hypothetical protein
MSNSAKLFLETHDLLIDFGDWHFKVTLSYIVGMSNKRPLCFILISFLFQFIYGFVVSRNGIPSIVATSSSKTSKRY